MTSILRALGSVAPIDEVLTWLIQSTVLLAMGLLAGRFLKGRGPAVLSALYRTILVALLVCPIASITIAAMGFPGLVIRVPNMARADGVEVADRGPDRAGPSDRDDSSAVPTSLVHRADAPAPARNPIGLPGGVAMAVGPPNFPGTGTAPEPVESVTGPDGITAMALILLVFWLLGTAILALRLLLGQRRMARLRGTAIAAEPEAQALCRELAGRMRVRLPGVFRSPFLSSPCLEGLRRPAILLPEDADQHLRDTFVHELAHLGRRDGLWNLARQLATAALWMQPLLWVLSRRIEETAEEVCDDIVVAFGADRGRYAGHLLELARRRLPPPAPTGVGMISLRSLLARRITRILDPTRSLSTRAGRRALTTTLLAGLAGTILAGLVGIGGPPPVVGGDEEETGTPTAGNPTEPESRTTVKGRVVDQDGRPVAGATVASARYRRGGIGSHRRDADRQEIDRAVTDAEGRFSMEVIDVERGADPNREDPDRWGPPSIVAWATGFGPVWSRTLARELTEAQPIRLVPDDVPITGRLVDAEGKPVTGGISVELEGETGDVRPRVYSSMEPIGADGRFRIDNLAPGGTYRLQARDRMAYGLSASGKMEPDRFKTFEVARDVKPDPGQVVDLGTFSAATGQAIRTSQPPAAAKHDQGKVAARDVSITGRIIDLEGRPIAGVAVTVAEIAKAREGDLAPWLEAVRRGERPWVAYRHLEQVKEKPSGKAKTDAQGRFRIGGLGAEEVVYLLIEGPTVAHTRLPVVTRQIEPLPARGFGNDYGPSTDTIHGADFTFTAAPGRVVEGVVRDAGDGRGMKDVGVWSYKFAGTHIVGIMTLKTRTDGDGRFRLAGFPKGDGNQLLVVPNDNQPFLMREVVLPDPQGLGAIPIEIDLHKGTWIEGKVTDKETGAPVAGAFLHYLPFLDNKSVLAAPEFHGGLVHGASYQNRYLSKSDGTFRLVGLPGRAIVGAVVYTGKPYRMGAGAESIQGMDAKGQFATAYNPLNAGRLFPTSMKEINPAEGAETVHVDIELDPGARVRLRVVDPRGKPVTGVKTAGCRQRGRYADEPEAQAEFDVATLAPGEDRVVMLIHEGRRLGRTIYVKEGDDRDGPVVVTLEPAATIAGRIVDRDGNPVSGATVRCFPRQDSGFPIQLTPLSSGPDGSFTVANLATGCGYSLVVEEARPGLAADQRGFAIRKDVPVRPSETTDLGEIPLGRRP